MIGFSVSIVAQIHLNHASQSGLNRVRWFLVLILLVGLLGTLAELLLARHIEDAWQWIPLALIGLALVILAWRGLTHRFVRQGVASLRALQALMLLFILSGFLGIGLHMRAKMEFKKESDPSLGGWKLLVQSLESKMPPPLAPGAMIQLGLLGLAYAYRHPGLSSKAKDARAGRE